MVQKIEKTIVDYKVVERTEAAQEQQVPDLSLSGGSPADNIVRMHEEIDRPQQLLGTTYKLKPPVYKHALYVTINDIVLNPDTPYERRRPFEIFVNSKNMEHFQWMVALTRILSAVFRKGGDITFLVEELEAVFDPKGGYFKKGGKYMPSIVAEIGLVIETHMKSIGLIKDEEMPDSTKEHLNEKRIEFERLSAPEPNYDGDFPSGSQLCRACNTVAMVFLDGCMTCLNCGDSKCS